MVEFTGDHTIYYSNKQHVPLEDVANSLLALSHVVQRSEPIFNDLMPGTRVASIQVYIDELKSGSLTEKIIVKVFFGSQREFDKFLKQTRTTLALDCLKDKTRVFAYLGLTIVLVGGYFALRRQGASEDRLAIIQNHADLVINQTSQYLGIEPDELRKVIERNVRQNADLARDAVKFVRPAQSDPDANIIFDGDERTSFSPKVIQAFPKEIYDLPPQDFIEELRDVEVQIRSLDLDSTKKGWSARIPQVSSDRVKLQLAPFLNGDDLMHHPVFRGNVTVIYEVGEKDERKPRLFFLSDILKPKSDVLSEP
jgi:hypothetical protein